MRFDLMPINFKRILLIKDGYLVKGIDKKSSFSGIYGCVCKKTSRVYIGSSKNILKRISQHIKSLKKVAHDNISFQNAFNYYGEENFNWYFLEEIAKEENLLQAEQRWLDIIKPFQRNGFNINKSAIKPPSFKGKKRKQRGKKEKERRACLNRGTFEPLKIKDPQGFIHEFICDYREFGKIHNLCPAALSLLFKGKIKQTRGWSLPDFENKIYKLKDSHGKEYNFKNISKFCKENFLNKSSISLVLMGKIKIHRGFSLIEYYNEYDFVRIKDPNGFIYEVNSSYDFYNNYNISKRSLTKILREFNKFSKGWSLEETPRKSLFSPWGDEFYIFNQVEFCKDNNLNEDLISKVITGQIKQEGGWSLTKIDNLNMYEKTNKYLNVIKNLISENSGWALKFF